MDSRRRSELRMVEPNFNIVSNKTISKICIENKMLNFQQVALYIKKLPYGRNNNKEKLETVFIENCGTCSTKHALLKTLAIENEFDELKLMIAIFTMNESNTPKIAKILKTNQLNYIPEAHCFLRFQNQILDYTSPAIQPSRYINDIVEEIEILADQISDFKVNFQKNYMKDWLKENPQIKMTNEDLWTVRELCIQELSK